MKRHKSKYNLKFDVNNLVVNIDLLSQCVTYNPQEKSYRKKLCKLVLSNTVNCNREFIQVYFSNMKYEAVFIANHIDTHKMKFNIFGKQHDTNNTVLVCNYKLYTIYSVLNKEDIHQCLM